MLHRALSRKESMLERCSVAGLGVVTEHGGVTSLDRNVKSRLRASRYSVGHLEGVGGSLLVLLLRALKERVEEVVEVSLISRFVSRGRDGFDSELQLILSHN